MAVNNFSCFATTFETCFILHYIKILIHRDDVKMTSILFLFTYYTNINRFRNFERTLY